MNVVDIYIYIYIYIILYISFFLLQVMSVADLCSAYVFLARYNLKNRNLEAAEMYAHKCCEFNEVN